MNSNVFIKRQDNWLLMGTLLVALIGAMVGTLAVIDREHVPLEPSKLAFLPKGEYLRVVSLGYRQLVADMIWIEVLHQYGNHDLSMEGFQWTYHAVDVLTDLDPTFVFAYQATGTNLAVSAHLITESIAILEKGAKHNPEAWVLPFLLGYDHMIELHDFATAAKHFRTASSLPGAPAYLAQLAMKMSVKSGDPATALEFLQRLYQQTSDEHVREGLAERIKEVLTVLDVRFLEEGVRRYRSRHGKMPETVQDLVSGGVIERVPNEPLGGEYLLNRTDGTVMSTKLEQRLHLYSR